MCRGEHRALMSRTAALMASSASMLQCSFTGGRLRCFAMSLFLIVSTCARDWPESQPASHVSHYRQDVLARAGVAARPLLRL